MRSASLSTNISLIGVPSSGLLILNDPPASRIGSGGFFFHLDNQYLKALVPRRGLEPPRFASLIPETSASTNSAIRARYEEARVIKDDLEIVYIKLWRVKEAFCFLRNEHKSCALPISPHSHNKERQLFEQVLLNISKLGHSL
jgi:hypothetical protein